MEDLRTEMTEKIHEMVKAKVTCLTGIWSEVGMNFETTKDRLDRTMCHVSKLLDSMVNAEMQVKDRLLHNIRELRAELENLSSELVVDNPEVPDTMTVIEKENAIRERVEHLRQLKNNRQREWRKLRAKENELCAKLGVPTLDLGSGSVPSEKELRELGKRIATLEREKSTAP